MKVGDIVRLKPSHQLKEDRWPKEFQELMEGNFVIREIWKDKDDKTYFRLKLDDGETEAPWVLPDEVISVSEIRQKKLKQLGI